MTTDAFISLASSGPQLNDRMDDSVTLKAISIDFIRKSRFEGAVLNKSVASFYQIALALSLYGKKMADTRTQPC